MSDLLMREVEEELRQDRYKKLWDKYGIWLILAALAIVGSVGGYRGWQAWEASRAATAGDKFLAAVSAAEEENFDEARSVLTELKDGSPGDYDTLAALRLAGVEAAAGNREAALAELDQIAADGGADDLLRAAADIRAALLLVDTADYALIEGRVTKYTDPANAWRHSARDVLAQSAYRNENWSEAQKWLDQILADPSTPQNLAGRVRLLSALVTSKLPAAEAPQSNATR